MLSGFKRALVIGPHTDDCEIGAGGTVSKLLRNGVEVKFLVFSDCIQSVPYGFPTDCLRKEALASAKSLGVTEDNLEVLSFEVRNFSERRQEILEKLVAVRNSFRPDLVLTTSSFDFHQDHSVIHQESLRAFNKSTLLGYEIVWNCANFNANTVITLEENDLVNKWNALKCFESQSFREYFAPKYLQSLAVVRGGLVHSEYGEAFECIRLKF